MLAVESSVAGIMTIQQYETDKKFNLVSLGRTSDDDMLLDINLWGTLNILHKKDAVSTGDIGPCVITFTNNKKILEDIIQNSDLTLDDFEEHYIYYGNYLYTLKDTNKIKKNTDLIISNIRKSQYWLDIIGVQI